MEGVILQLEGDPDFQAAAGYLVAGINGGTFAVTVNGETLSSVAGSSGLPADSTTTAAAQPEVSTVGTGSSSSNNHSHSYV